MMKKIITICFIILILFTISGCSESEIKSEEEVQEAIVGVSEDISDISDTLEEIDEDLGK